MTPMVRCKFSSGASASPGNTPERRGIPFDYAFRYELRGKPGNVINSLVTISIEATFTAVSIGYGVVPKVQPFIFGPEPEILPPGPSILRLAPQTLLNIPLGDIFRVSNVN